MVNGMLDYCICDASKISFICLLYLFHFSLLVVETADRPGLLVDLVKIIDDINITVQSGEFDTEVTLII